MKTASSKRLHPGEEFSDEGNHFLEVDKPKEESELESWIAFLKAFFEKGMGPYYLKGGVLLAILLTLYILGGLGGWW